MSWTDRPTRDEFWIAHLWTGEKGESRGSIMGRYSLARKRHLADRTRDVGDVPGEYRPKGPTRMASTTPIDGVNEE